MAMGKTHHRNRRSRHGNSGTSGDNKTTVQINLPAPPPDHIFKYRKHREKPALDIAMNNFSYIPTEFEFREGEGCFVHWYGVPLPSRTVPTAQALVAVDGVKRFFINSLRFLGSMPLVAVLLLRKKALNKTLAFFNDSVDKLPGVAGWYLEDGYYCAPVKELREFIAVTLHYLGIKGDVAWKISEIIGMMFEYDLAYRWRFQDMMMYAEKDACIKDFPKEIKRLLDIEASHEPHADVKDKLRHGEKLIRWAWYIPRIRNAIRKGLWATDFDKCKLDESDIYHSVLYADYNVQGKTLEERLTIMEGYHGMDQSKWPPRVTLK